MSSTTDSYQPYVEDYDSTISEVVPLTRRHTTTRKSGLSQEMSSSYDGISDSGYSSTNTPNNETPPLKSTTPPPEAPVNRERKDSYKRAPTPGMQRPSNKAYNRTASPAIPRNIPGAKPRERSPTTGGADECDCADCKKDAAKATGSPSSPSVLNGTWPLHGSYQGSYHGSYSQSPSFSGYPYPPTRYDGYSAGSDLTDGSEKKRTSMAPPPRPSSTFSGTTASSYTGYTGSYLPHASSPAPGPPTPSSTCPPTSFSAYAPPPLNTSMASPPGPYSPYGPPSAGISPYTSYTHDSWSRSSAPITPTSSYPPSSDYSMPPPPPVDIGRSGGHRRHNSMRAQAARGAYEHDEYDDYTITQPPQRRSSRVHSTDRPTSWIPSSYFDMDRSISVPPGGSAPCESRRKTTTPGPTSSRRRESTHSTSSSSMHSSRIGPSALSRAMDSCAIDDDPSPRPFPRSHNDYYSHHSALTRRDPGTLAHPDPREELVRMTVPDADGETFTMRYPAGMPVKVNLNGKHVSLGGERRSVESAGMETQNMAYRYVQQRQQQVHAQLRYGASGEYAGAYRPRRTTLSGGAGM